MRELGLERKSGRRRVRTTIVDKAPPRQMIICDGTSNRRRRTVAWCGDITYLHNVEGWRDLATVLDMFSRRVIGWAAADHMRTELVSDALDMAVATRGGHVAGVVFHTDRGSVLTSRTFGELCDARGVVQSMGATGVCQQRCRELVRDHETRARSPASMGTRPKPAGI